MATTLVNNSKDLMSALKAAKAGDTVLMAEGTYSGIKLHNLDLSGITVTSANVGKQAVLTDIDVQNVTGLTLRQLELSATVANKQVFRFSNVGQLSLDKLNVHGPEGSAVWQDVASLKISNATDATVTDTTFHHMGAGLTVLNSTGVTVSKSYFHDIRSDGIHGGGNSDFKVDSNSFIDFYPRAGDHADAVQLWTTGVSQGSNNITVTNNLIMRGDGAPFQGIFIKDENTKLPYKNVVIEDNLLVGTNWRGISVDHADGLKIAGNTVLGYADRNSGISTDDSSDVSVTGNVSTAFSVEGLDRLATGNRFGLAVADDGAQALRSWLAGQSSFRGAWGSAKDFIERHGVSLSAAAQALTAPQFVEVLGDSGNNVLRTVVDHDSRLNGGAGNDVLHGAAATNNELIGGRGDDSYHVYSANDLVIELAGEGQDKVTASVSYTLGANVEDLVLKVGGLTGIGNGLDNTIRGSDGDDCIYGMAGDDGLSGGDGRDEIHGGDGADDVRGGAGDDTLYGDGGNDYILGGDGHDLVYGGTGNDQIKGDAGNDTLYGDAGNDTLWGGAGNDVLIGGDGDDMLMGDEGSDCMTGGAGRDTFRFGPADVDKNSCDTIVDFTRGSDRIDLRSIDSIASTAKNDTFTFIGSKTFSGHAGELRMDKVADGLHITADVDGDRVADISIMLLGVSAVSTADFIL